jgi:antitoxin component YwqK of YwqJK toxin-antitoxin module
MKLVTFAILMLTVVCMYSQETILKINQRSTFIEEYDVLVSNKKIKHGNYVNYSIGWFGKIYLNECGRYYLNNKDSVWTTYQGNQIKEVKTYKNGILNGPFFSYFIATIGYKTENEFKDNKGRKNDSLLISLADNLLQKRISGLYLNNEKQGVWSYFYKDGQKYFAYDYTDSVLMFYNLDVNINEEILNPETPVYIGGGLEGLMLEITPIFEKNEWTLDTTEITFNFKLDNEGNLVNVSILDSPYSKGVNNNIIKKFKLREKWVIKTTDLWKEFYDYRLPIKIIGTRQGIYCEIKTTANP